MVTFFSQQSHWQFTPTCFCPLASWCPCTNTQKAASLCSAGLKLYSCFIWEALQRIRCSLSQSSLNLDLYTHYCKKQLQIFHHGGSICSVLYFVVKHAKQMEIEEQLNDAGLQPTVVPCMFLLNLISIAFGTYQWHCYFSCLSKNSIQEFLCNSLCSSDIGSLLPLEYNKRTMDLDRSSNTFRNFKEGKNVLKLLDQHNYTGCSQRNLNNDCF